MAGYISRQTDYDVKKVGVVFGGTFSDCRESGQEKRLTVLAFSSPLFGVSGGIGRNGGTNITTTGATAVSINVKGPLIRRVLSLL